MRTKTNLTANVEDGSDACACHNCDWAGPLDECEEVDDIGARLDPGSEVPAGQCPDCGALAYLVKESKDPLSERAPLAAISALNAARAFIAGFEGDELQEGISELLAQIDRAISGASVYLAVHVEGGCVQSVSSNDPEALAGVGVILLDRDNDGEEAPGSFALQYQDGDSITVCGGPLSVDRSGVDFAATWVNAEKAGEQEEGA